MGWGGDGGSGLGGKAVATETKPSLSMFYTIEPNDWYKTYPYYFQIKKTDFSLATFYLPIPPQQMSIEQVSAAEAHATLGGVVTEVSAPVFYMINLAGTTGMSLSAVGVNTPGSQVKQRQTFEELSGGTNIMAKFARSVAKNAEDLVGGFVTPEQTTPFFKYGSAVNTLKEKIEKPKTPETWENLSEPQKGSEGLEKAWNSFKESVGGAVRAAIGNINDNKQASWYLNGFTWEHALRQFFLIYQRERGAGEVLQLYFVDAKSNTRYACVPKRVQFTKTANTPFVSQYNISLKCWSDQDGGSLDATATSSKSKEIDRFGDGGDLAEVYTVSVAAAVGSFYRTYTKWNRKKSVGSALMRDAGGSFLA